MFTFFAFLAGMLVGVICVFLPAIPDVRNHLELIETKLDNVVKKLESKM